MNTLTWNLVCCLLCLCRLLGWPLAAVRNQKELGYASLVETRRCDRPQYGWRLLDRLFGQPRFENRRCSGFVAQREDEQPERQLAPDWDGLGLSNMRLDWRRCSANGHGRCCVG